MGFIAFLFFVLVFGGWAVGKLIGNIFFPERNTGGYIDRSVHHHHHHHTHTHQNLTVIDDETHKRALKQAKKNLNT